MKSKIRQIDFLYYNFQDILNCSYPGFFTEEEIEKYYPELVDKFKRECGYLRVYTDVEIWQHILTLFNKNFDYLMDLIFNN